MRLLEAITVLSLLSCGRAPELKTLPVTGGMTLQKQVSTCVQCSDQRITLSNMTLNSVLSFDGNINAIGEFHGASTAYVGCNEHKSVERFHGEGSIAGTFLDCSAAPSMTGVIFFNADSTFDGKFYLEDGQNFIGAISISGLDSIGTYKGFIWVKCE